MGRLLSYSGISTKIRAMQSKLISESEIQEMLNVCTRLVVMKDRNIVGELKDEQLTQSNIMKTIAGGK